MKYASHLFFSYEESEDDSIYRQTNNFTKTIIPFNIYEELNLLATPKSSRYPYIGNLMLVGAPLLLVIIACFGLQFKLITDLFLNCENLNLFAKFCTGFSSMLILLQVFFFISTTLNNFLNKDGS